MPKIRSLQQLRIGHRLLVSIKAISMRDSACFSAHIGGSSHSDMDRELVQVGGGSKVEGFHLERKGGCLLSHAIGVRHIERRR